jgi:glycosyltransferase involved in cell wall biosynthesis
VSSRPKVLWIDRVIWPYRVPVWQALGERVDLTVAVFSEVEPNRPQFPLERIPGVTTVRLRTGMLTALGNDENPLYVAVGARALVKRVVPDVLVLSGWESPAYRQVRRHAKALGAGHVQFYGGTATTHRFDKGPIAWLRREFFRKTDAVISYSPAAADEVVSFGVPERRVFVGFNSVDVRRFHEGVERYRTAAKSGHRFICVGQLIRRKNVAAIIGAFCRIANLDDELLIVGVGPLEDELRVAAGSTEQRGRIRFLGFRAEDDLLRALGEAQTAILASTEEVWGLVVNEALAGGLHAVVSTRTGAASGVGGMRGVWLADPTVAGLARAMEDSRAQWRGPITAPEIMEYTPKRYADVAFDAIAAALRDKG